MRWAVRSGRAQASLDGWTAGAGVDQTGPTTSFPLEYRL